MKTKGKATEITEIKKEVIAKLIECQNNHNTETAHINADDLLCEFLTALGYADVVAEYNEVSKWFA